MIPIAGIASKTLGKRIGKVVTEAQEKSGFLNTHLIELFKNHKLIKIKLLTKKTLKILTLPILTLSLMISTFNIMLKKKMFYQM